MQSKGYSVKYGKKPRSQTVYMTTNRIQSLPFLLDAGGIDAEKVIVECGGNAEQHLDINGGTVVNLINVGAAIRKFIGKPDHRSALLLHLFPDKLSDMYIHTPFSIGADRLPGFSYIINKV